MESTKDNKPIYYVKKKLYLIIEKINTIQEKYTPEEINVYNCKISALSSDLKDIEFYVEDLQHSLK